MQPATRSSIAARLQALDQFLDEACDGTRQRPHWIAVSKGHATEIIRLAYELGIRDFGESYVRELEEKHADLEGLEGINFHFIGTLQSNKIQRIVRCCKSIMTLTSIRHARMAATYARQHSKTPYPVFIQVNLGQEVQKAGVSLEDASTLAADLTRNFGSDLSLQGILAVCPAHISDTDTEIVPDLFRRARQVASTVGQGLLSLGMTHDLRLAVQAGSDVLRLGTFLFGDRPERPEAAQPSETRDPQHSQALPKR